MRARFVGVLGIFWISGLSVASWLSRSPTVRDELHASTLQMGVLAFGISAGSIAGFALANVAARRLSPRRAIVGSLIVACAGLVLSGVSSTFLNDFPLTLVAMMLLGLGNGVCNVTMNVEGAGIEHDLAQPVMPWFHASFSIGAVVGAAGGALAATFDISPMVQLTIVAVVSCALLPFAARPLTSGVAPSAARRRDRRPRPSGSTLRQAWLEPRTLAIGLVVVGMSFANGAGNNWITLGMVDSRGADDGLAALAVDVFSFAIVVARLGGVPLLARFGRVRVIRVSAIVAAAGLLLFILVPAAPASFAGVALWGFGVALAFPVGMSAAGDDPRNASARIAVVAAIGYAGSLVGPPLIGFIAGGVGVVNALFVVLALVAAAGIAAPALAPRMKSGDEVTVEG